MQRLAVPSLTKGENCGHTTRNVTPPTIRQTDQVIQRSAQSRPATPFSSASSPGPPSRRSVPLMPSSQNTPLSGVCVRAHLVIASFD